MTESMIEKAGDAVLAALSSFNDPDLSSALGYIMQEPLDARALELRRIIGQAAIEVMMEPTKTQLEAMEPWSRVSGHHEQVWKAGVRAALIWPAGSADRAGVPLARD